MIYTFYSYKGGVGRSMAVANMAELLCEAGLNVLIIDWDLEAPGLERYFPISVREALAHEGLMDMLLSYKESMAQPPPPELVRSSVSAAAAEDGPRGDLLPQSDAGGATNPVLAQVSQLEVGPHLAPDLPDVKRYLISLPSPPGSKGALSLMTAGRRDGENLSLYANTVRTFDWQDFYRNWDGEIFFDWFRDQLLGGEIADVVLIDSRTGVTEMGGVCTYHLADAVIMFCAPNQQNLTGTSDMAANFTSDKVRALRPERPLRVVIIPSRVEDRAEVERLNEFKASFVERFKEFAKRFEPPGPAASEDGGEVFWQLKIPHVPYFAFNEVVAVRAARNKRLAYAEDMVRSFNLLAQRMAELAPPDTKINRLLKQKKRELDVYLSYSQDDSEEVMRLAERLKAEGISTFFPEQDILPGEHWEAAITDALKRSRACALIIGQRGPTDWHLRELRRLADLTEKEDFRIIPVFLPGARTDDELPPALAARTRVSFKDGLDDRNAFRALVQGIRGVAPGDRQTAGLSDETPPYRGLSTFYEEHAPLFFGREKFVERLIESLRRGSFVAVVGKSGSGKTAVLQAGLIPKLRKGAIRGSESWLIATLRPTDKPFRALATALLPFLSGLDESGALAEAIGRMDDPNHLEDDALKLALTKVVNKGPEPTRLLLLVDPLQDLFSLCKDEIVRSRFLTELILAIGRGNVCVVLAMRSDAVADAQRHEAVAEYMKNSTLELNPMTREELLSAISEPARKRNVEFESGLAERILNDLGDEPGHLPLLSQTLSELWGRRQDGKLTNAAYGEMGGVQGCFVRHVAEVYEGLSPEKQETARRIFLRLAPPARSHGYAPRRRLTLAELGKDQEKTRAVVNVLTEARIAVTGSEDGAETVELAYGDLLNKWARLKSWIEADREFVYWLQRLQASVDEWVMSNRDQGALLAGGPLREAERWLDKRGEDLNDIERDFIEASVYFRKRVRRVGVGLAAALVLGLAAWFVVGWIQARERDMAHSRQLAVASKAQLDKDPELSILLAGEATTVRETDEAKEALTAALRTRLRATFYLLDSSSPDSSKEPFRRTNEYAQIAFSPDGGLIVAASTGGRVRVWNAATKNPVHEILDNNGFYGALFSPDTKTVLIPHKVGPTNLYETTTGKTIATLSTGTPRISIFSPDGRFILTTLPYDSTLYDSTLWDASSGVRLMNISGDSPIISASFSPDGRLMAMADFDGQVKIVETESGKTLSILSGHDGRSIYSSPFSYDGRLIATAGAGDTVRVWEVNTGKLLVTKNYEGTVARAYFSPDDKYLITLFSQGATTTRSDPQGYIRVWETGSWRQLYDLPRDLSNYNVAISRDSKVMAIPRANTVALVNLADGEPLFPSWRADNDSVTGVVFSPDGKSLLTVGRDVTVRLWDVRPEQEALPSAVPDLLKLICTRVSGNMNDEDKAQYTSYKNNRLTCENLPPRPSKPQTFVPPIKPIYPTNTPASAPSPAANANTNARGFAGGQPRSNRAVNR